MSDAASIRSGDAPGAEIGPAIVTVEQMRALERGAEGAGIPTDRLMANAGLTVANWLDHEAAPWLTTK